MTENYEMGNNGLEIAVAQSLPAALAFRQGPDKGTC
jgi:hypothetical protein